jgi:hypothetical protein
MDKYINMANVCEHVNVNVQVHVHEQDHEHEHVHEHECQYVVDAEEKCSEAFVTFTGGPQRKLGLGTPLSRSVW